MLHFFGRVASYHLTEGVRALLFPSQPSVLHYKIYVSVAKRAIDSSN